MQSGQEILTLNGDGTTVTSVAFSPDGNRVASGSYDGTIKVWPTNPRGEDERMGGDVYRFAMRDNLTHEKVAAEIQSRLQSRPKALATAMDFLASLPPEHPFWKNRAAKRDP